MIRSRQIIYFFVGVFIFYSLEYKSALGEPDSGALSINRPGQDPLVLYKDSYALLIGASKYLNNSWHRLPDVEHEIIEVSDALTKQGFKTEVILNPKRQEFESLIRSFVDRYGYEADNRLLFFFAGHGYSRGSKGYLVPVDAPDPIIDKYGFIRNSISMQTIAYYAKEIESRHVLFVFDSCFSGTIFETRSLPPVSDTYIRESTGKPVRQFITAGDAGQEVPARSIFTPLFIRGIEGDADFNRDGYVTGTELGVFITQRIPDYHTGQTPQYGKLRDVRLDRGDFVFRIPESGFEQSSFTNKDSDAIRSRNLPDLDSIYINTEKDRTQSQEPTAWKIPGLDSVSKPNVFLVFWDHDSNGLTPEAEYIVSAAATTFKEGGGKLLVEGHTDTSGGAKYNLAISVQRAEIVRDKLVSLGIPSSKIIAEGRGEEDLLVPTPDNVREPQNRFVKISILD